MSDDAFDPDDMNDADWPSVRASLRDVVVPADAREAAIAAALGEFDELRATPTTVVSLASRRKRQYRMLSYAAAAVAVLFVGGVIVRNGRSTSTPAMSASEKAAATASPAMASAAESTVAGQGAAQSLSGAADTALPPVAEADASGTTSNGTPQNAVATIGAIAGPAEAGGTAVSATAVAEQVATPDINSPEALASYARTLAEAGPSLMQGDSCPPTAATTLGTVNYRGHLAVVRRASDGTITAVDLASCAVLATTAP